MFNEVVNNVPTLYRDSVRKIYIDGGFEGACSLLAMSIWHNMRRETILNKLTDCASVHLNSRYTNNQFTPMTLASIQGNLPIMEALKIKGADLDAQDILGYTPLHHMAMLGNEMGVKNLLDWGASPDLRTKDGATYMDFLRFNAPFRNGALSFDPKLFSAHMNDHTKFDMSCIPSDAKPVDEMIATPAMLTGIYATEAYRADTKEKLHPFLKKEQPVFLPLYDAFKKNPPTIAVKPAGNFCGLFAEQRIKKGEIIAEYTGLLTVELSSYQNGEYLWSQYPAIDAGPFRSAGSMANEGFPNAGVTMLQRGENGLDGLPNRKLLFALEDIEPGEEIWINYGGGEDLLFKWDENYQALGFESLKKYMKAHTWDKISKSIHSLAYGKLTPGTSAYADGMNNKEKVFYILEAPSVFAKMVREGLIHQKDFEKIEGIKKVFDQLNPATQETREKVLRIAKKAVLERTAKDEI